VIAQLTPAEFHYLSHPLSANGVDLLKYTLQDLCIKEVIKVEARQIQIDARLKRARVRYFFCRDSAFSSYKTTKSHELFILNLLENAEEFRFYVLRHLVKKEFKKRGLVAFKSDLLLEDLAQSKMTMLKFFPNGKGLKLSKEMGQDLDRIGRLVKKDVDAIALQRLLDKVGSNVLFLPESVQEKLQEINSSAKNVENLKFLEIIQNQFQHFDSFFVGSAFISGGGISGFSGGFDGFGGGDFGGGGAIGGW
jgi:uncharacterized membrane protein YgcG